MESVAIPFGIMAYQSRSLPWNAQRLVNWYPESAPPEAKAKTQVVLLPTPGLDLFSTVTGACRGSNVMNDLLYMVIGNTLYLIQANGVAASLGMITGSATVSMANNGDQLTVVSEPFGWVYTKSTNTFQQITDPDFPGSAYVTQVGGYFVHVVPDNSGQFFVSDLNDGLSFDALNFATAEMDGDKLVAAVGDHGELWLFGSFTIEPWGVTGDVDFPFAPIQSAKIQRGCEARFSIARQDNSLFWIGDDFVVYRAAGYVPRRVSTHAVEKAMQEAGDLSGVIAGSYTQDGHSFWYMTLPGVWSFFYDNATGIWHERQTFGEDNWLANNVQQVYGTLLAGHESGNVYELDLDTFTENGTRIQRIAISPPTHANTSRVTMSRLQIDVQAGMGLNSGQGSDPQAMLQWSDDGGRTWSYEHWRSMGEIGQYKRRVIWRRLGQFYSRVFKLTISDPIFPAILGAYADMEVTPP